MQSKQKTINLIRNELLFDWLFLGINGVILIYFFFFVFLPQCSKILDIECLILCIYWYLIQHLIKLINRILFKYKDPILWFFSLLASKKMMKKRKSMYLKGFQLTSNYSFRFFFLFVIFQVKGFEKSARINQ